ncbi:MAG: hypothetical protein KatS3mg009_2042 [Acidimicrobiia bacterium]|nr:MAG: hypothetical protein KatS3mg009_2042 [Acidimicrobiia bacterium]
MSDAVDARARRFAAFLGAVAAVALAVRVAYVLVERRDFDPGGDAYFYHAGANLLADGHGFVSPFHHLEGRAVPAAEHPPLYLVYLAIPSALGLGGVLAHLLWSCVLGVATVVVTGLVGRAVGGDRVGLLAAAAAAVHPNLWAPDGMLQAETASTFAATLAVWLAYRYWARPGGGRLAAVAAAVGAGALARSELALLVPLLVVPLALARRDRPWRTRLRWAAAATLTALAVVSPWLVYNATRFEHPVLLSTQIDQLLASANCDSTYFGSLQGYYDITCAMAVARREGLDGSGDQSEEGRVYRRAALDYVREHLGELPRVTAVRLLRSVALYAPARHVRMDVFFEGRETWVAWAALFAFYTVALAAVAGAVVVRRDRRVPLFPLLAPVGMVLVTVVVTYASTRFRAAAEPVLVVLAAVAAERAGRLLVAAARRKAAGGSAAPRPRPS